MVKTFDITVSMEERWIPHFLTMLKEMENNGKAGRSRLIAFYSDGDGDFQPKFMTTYPFDAVNKVKANKEYVAKYLNDLYDAG